MEEGVSSAKPSVQELVTFGGSTANLLHFSWQHDLLVMTEKMKNSLHIGGSFCTHRVI
jgi:hypothetical protein